MGWEDLQKQLVDVFTTDDIIGKRILYVIEREKEYGVFVEDTYRGHCILMNAFQEFYMGTIESAASVWKEKERRPTPLTYTESVLWHLGNFRSIRAVDILFHNGYPMDGFARLRYLKESALYLAAMLSGLTTYSQIKGWDGASRSTKQVTDEEMELIRKRRMKEEKRVLELMIRKKSGLAEHDIAELGRWEGLFNKEVHGAFWTHVFEHGPAMKGEDATSLAPKPRKLSCAMLMNRFEEVAWMLHRTLPIMQLSTHRFSTEWMGKWKLLDQNFFVTEKSLAEAGKSIGDVFIRLMQAKFPFNEEICFDTHV